MKILSRDDFEVLKAVGMLYEVMPECDGSYEDYLSKQVSKGETMSFKDMKIRIKDEEHSKKVQEKLLEEGYRRGILGNRPLFTHVKALYCSNGGFITFSSVDTPGSEYYNEDYFDWHPYEEHYLTYDGMFEPGPEDEEPENKVPEDRLVVEDTNWDNDWISCLDGMSKQSAMDYLKSLPDGCILGVDYRSTGESFTVVSRFETDKEYTARKEAERLAEEVRLKHKLKHEETEKRLRAAAIADLEKKLKELKEQE